MSDSKDRLTRSVQRHLESCFIGSLAMFEEEFGELWGLNTKDSLLTDIQRKNRERWRRVRSAILNSGNAKMRTLLIEIDHRRVEDNPGRAEFHVRQANGKGNG